MGVDLVVDVLATWRLTRLFGTDKLTEALRDDMVGLALGFKATKITRKFLQLMDCPYCLSVWAAGIILILNRLPGGKLIVRLLAMSAVAGELSHRLDSWDE